jgi:hypothetical protein
MKIKKSFIYSEQFVFIVLITVLYWFAYESNTQFVDRIIHHKTTDTILVHGQQFSEESLIELIKNCNIKYPHIVLAQAKIESGNYKSKIFKQNNNLFGMRKAHTRITTALGDKNTFAYYRDWTDCVYDYAMYQTSVMSNIHSEEQYLQKLGEKYAQDTIYISALKTIIERENLKNKFK